MAKRKHAGLILREWREEKGLSQKALADLLKVRQGAVSTYETAKSTPHLAVAVRIEEATEGRVPMRAWAA